MKIILDARIMLPEMTGIGRYILGLMSGFHRIEMKDTIEVWLQRGLERGHPVWEYDGGGVSLRQLPLRHMDFRQHWFVSRQLRLAEADIYHNPHFDLPLGIKGKVITTIHDLKYLAIPGFFPRYSRLKRLVLMLMMGYAVRRSDLIISVSQSTRYDLFRFFGVPAEKVKVVYEGVSEIFYQSPAQKHVTRVRNKYGLERPYFLFVGERRPHKNIERLVEAFEMANTILGNQFDLVIVGKKYADFQAVDLKIESSPQRHNIRLLDYVADEELPVLYHLATGFVFVSLYEGFGLPLLEAMASATPVICSNTTSLPEVAGGAALMVSPDNVGQIAEAMVRIATNQDLREEFAQLGRKRAEMFTWQKAAAEVLNIYHQVASNNV